jgi:NADH-quinone oxidoreductase subunit G
MRPLPVGLIGEAANLTYPYDHLGAGPTELNAIAAGRHPFAGVLKDAAKPMLILGQGALARADGAAILALARRIAEATGMVTAGAGWNGFNVLHTAAARVGGLDLGFLPQAGGRDLAGVLAGAEAGEIDIVYLLGADEIDTHRLSRTFVVYQGHHGDAGAARADVVLPGAAYTEKDATWVNTEGRVQRGLRACFPPGEAREDWRIIRALSAVLNKTLPYDSLAAVRAGLVGANRLFAQTDTVEAAPWGEFGQEGPLGDEPFVSPIGNFYLTNPICRASVTMARCVEAFSGDSLRKTGTDD